jgi:hypothetical protein
MHLECTSQCEHLITGNAVPPVDPCVYFAAPAAPSYHTTNIRAAVTHIKCSNLGCNCSVAVTAQCKLTADCATARAISECCVVDGAPAQLDGVVNRHVPAAAAAAQ